MKFRLLESSAWKALRLINNIVLQANMTVIRLCTLPVRTYQQLEDNYGSNVSGRVTETENWGT